MVRGNCSRSRFHIVLIATVVAAAASLSQLPVSAVEGDTGPVLSQNARQRRERKQVKSRSDEPQRKESSILKSIKLLRTNAGRPEWSPRGDEFISFHAKGKNGYYNIYIMKRDGSDVRCLTCDNRDLPGRNVGQPSWHPSGDWIVFQAEKEKHVLPKFGALAAPGIGFHNDIWVMTANGKKVYKLTDLATKAKLFDRTPTTAILQPHFSRNGALLSWSERIGDGGKWGKWVIRVADFVVENGTPRLQNVRGFTPGANQGYYESNDFMPGDAKLLICGNLERQQTEFGLDIYYLDLATQRTERLTHSQDVFDEAPHPSPDGSKIAYLSTAGFAGSAEGASKRRNDWWNWVRGEFWLMNPNGEGNTRLTYFNQEGSPEFTGKRVIPAYVSWNSTGDSLLLAVVSEEGKGRLEDQLYIAELEK